MKLIALAFITLLLSHAAFATEAGIWQLARTTIGRIENGEPPSKVCGPARQEYFLLLIDDAESIMVFQHPDGRCLVGFEPEEPADDPRKKHMIMSEPFSPADQGRPVVWIHATLDKAGSTPEFHKLVMLRNTGGITDTLFLRRKGKGVLIQWILS